MNYGVDFGARRLAVACPEMRVAAEIRLPDPTKKRPADPHRELRQLTEWFKGAVPDIAEIWVELPFVGRGNSNIRTAIRLGMTVGAVLACHAGPAHVVDQATWKASVIGNGNAGKPAVRTWLEEHHPALATLCGESQDLVDANCIALHGAQVAQAVGVRGAGPADLLRAQRVPTADDPTADRPGTGDLPVLPRPA